MTRFLASLITGACAAVVLHVGAWAQPALWKVTDADSTVWLFGSVHLLDPALEWRTPELDAAFAAADRVYFETDLSPAAQAETTALVNRYGFNPEGVVLSARLSEAGRQDLAAVAGELGVPVANLEPLRPWLAGVMIGVQLILADGADPAAGVDRVLHAEAAAAAKPILELETLEEQILALASLEGEAEDAFFEASLAQIRAQPDLLDATVAAWRSGDVAALGDLIVGAMAHSPAAYEALIAGRNRAWVEVLRDELAGSGEALVVVGAGHMVGDDGVHVLLAEAGFDVTRE